LLLHPSDAGQKFVLTAVEHSATEKAIAGVQAGEAEYHNSFVCIPASVTYRPGRVTRRPVVGGPQPAVVTGPQGEEIHTDKFGRIKVHFFWDRAGKADESSSCWVRVSEPWAGKNFGTVHVPRIGQEVIVDFLEGDPDRPIVTGRVYNATLMHPYPLPANKTQTGILTRSSTGGKAENANELRFEDKTDSEDIVFHAQKDFHRSVENDDDLKVGRDQTIEIKRHRTETVKEGDEKVTIEQGKREHTIKAGNDSLTVHGDHTIVVETGGESLTVKMGDQTTAVKMGASSTEAMKSITLKVGQNSITIDQQGIQLSGMNVMIKGQIQTQLAGVVTQIKGTAVIEMQGGVVEIN
jgi:type VI secretion system secreted protein VgrG